MPPSIAPGGRDPPVPRFAGSLVPGLHGAEPSDLRTCERVNACSALVQPRPELLVGQAPVDIAQGGHFVVVQLDATAAHRALGVLAHLGAERRLVDPAVHEFANRIPAHRVAPSWIARPLPPSTATSTVRRRLSDAATPTWWLRPCSSPPPPYPRGRPRAGAGRTTSRRSARAGRRAPVPGGPPAPAGVALADRKSVV